MQATATRTARRATDAAESARTPLHPQALRPARTTPRARPVPTGRVEPVGGTHLTRRGRLLVVLALVAILMAAFSLGRVASQAASTAGAGGAASVSYEQQTVQPGDSLWTVARRIAPHNDPREVIAQIRRINDLRSAQIQVGQQLLLPVRA